MNVSAKIICLCMLVVAFASCHRGTKATVAPPVRVKTMVVEPSDAGISRVYSGTVEESAGTELSFSALGTIRSINVEVGDRVGKGQLIGSLDATSLQNAYNISASALAEAQDAYNRMKMLHDSNSLPDMQWVQVQNTLKQAQSAEAIARKNLADANLYAPQSGYISEKTADAGMNVAPGIPVVKLVQINPVKVNISIPENEIAAIPEKARVAVTVDALGGKAFEGQLIEKGVAAKPLSRSYDVKFEVANPDSELLPGMICTVQMTADSVAQALVVPIDAVLLDADNSNFVWLARNGVAKKQIVKVEGFSSATGLVVGSGLQAGDSVIVSGQQKVSENMRVESID